MAWRGVLYRSQQILPLGIEEGEPVLGFLQFFERHHVDRPQVFEAGLELSGFFLCGLQAFARPARIRWANRRAMRPVPCGVLRGIAAPGGCGRSPHAQTPHQLRNAGLDGLQVRPARQSTCGPSASRWVLLGGGLLFQALEFVAASSRGLVPARASEPRWPHPLLPGVAVALRQVPDCWRRRAMWLRASAHMSRRRPTSLAEARVLSSSALLRALASANSCDRRSTSARSSRSTRVDCAMASSRAPFSWAAASRPERKRVFLSSTAARSRSRTAASDWSDPQLVARAVERLSFLAQFLVRHHSFLFRFLFGRHQTRCAARRVAPRGQQLPPVPPHSTGSSPPARQCGARVRGSRGATPAGRRSSLFLRTPGDVDSAHRCASGSGIRGRRRPAARPWRRPQPGRHWPAPVGPSRHSGPETSES